MIDKLIGRGGLPVTLTTKKWFIDFMADVELRYSCPTYSNIIQNVQKKSDAIRANLVENITLQCTGSFLLLFVESGTRKLRKVVESRTKFLFDVKRVLDSTTVRVLDSTPILLQ